MKLGLGSGTAVALAAVLAVAPTLSARAEPADPTQGGKGGRIIRVTTLAKDGPGSLAEALAAKGKRIVVFEVGGAIDLDRSVLNIAEPFLTIAGQTAPSPGITLLRGGIDVRTHDVKISHLRVLTGDAGQAKRSGWEADAFSTVSAHDVVIENNTFMWAVDENMSASGPRFTGETVDEWRKGTSRNITFRLNFAAEGLADSSHPKGEHSKGSLVHDNTSGIVFDRNIWAHNVERSPLVKGGAQVLMVNNFIYDPQHRAVHYNLMDLEWAGHAPVTGELTAIGNVMRGGNSTDCGLPFLMLGGVGDLAYYGRDNVAVDRHGDPLPAFGRYGDTTAKLIEAAKPLADVAGYAIMPSSQVETTLLATAGARPWDRGAEEVRVLFYIAEGRGEVIDSQDEVGGYPTIPATRAPFREKDWNLATMTPKSALYPGQKEGAQEHLSPRDRAMRKSN
ncbi:pectate lyase [Croceicoccus ponticola]|uniref:Pectate lyase n=1 Tax=Croceicoccus ponticola TaxID=2217664 RepID=A0A437GZN8_9SPHN|nr:pectate lyase [Croceicoccus ponticola]RVQ68800.1 pectate lyase [Croceicoccus ponticola]